MRRLKQLLSTQKNPSLDTITVSKAETRRILHDLNNVNDSKSETLAHQHLSRSHNALPDQQAASEDDWENPNPKGKQ